MTSDKATSSTVNVTYTVNGKPVDDFVELKDLLDVMDRLERKVDLSYATRAIDAVVTEAAVRSAERWALVIVTAALIALAGILVGARWF